MSQKWRKYPPEFKRDVLKRMRGSTNISALARELGIRRKLLYKWKEEAARDQPDIAGGSQAAAELEAAKLRDKVQRLEALVARQSLELDFFKGALQRVEERRRKRAATSGPPSTSKSGK